MAVLTAGDREFLLRREHELVPADEGESWVAAFEFLQMLRLRVQLDPGTAAARPNEVDVAALNAIDRRVLSESVRVARRLQQRIELDYRR